MRKRLIIIITLGAIAGLFVLPLNPVHSKTHNLLYLTCVLVTCLGLIACFWPYRILRFLPILAATLLLGAFLLPGRSLDPNAINQSYVRNLTSFEGTKYYWGGENSRGIDCSGLPRRSFRNAVLTHGLKTFNGKALRMYAQHWWFDASARALSEGYKDYTIPLPNQGTIQEMDYQNLRAGDLAVTADGVHMLVYMGDVHWIQADPGSGKVVTQNGRTDDNDWFKSPVTTLRWKALRVHQPSFNSDYFFH